MRTKDLLVGTTHVYLYHVCREFACGSVRGAHWWAERGLEGWVVTITGEVSRRAYLFEVVRMALENWAPSLADLARAAQDARYELPDE
jgi:hypothetical protein